MRVIIKIGSRVLTNEDKSMNDQVLSSLVDEVCLMSQTQEIEFVVVTSGAVSIGRSSFNQKTLRVKRTIDLGYSRRLLEDQVLAAIGQPKLMAHYINKFAEHDIECAQILVTRYDFADRDRYLSLKVVTDNLLDHGVIPIFNENDVLSPEELDHDFSDNDQLASMVGAMVGADKIIVLTNVEGLYDGQVGKPGSKVIPVIDNPMEFIDRVDDSESHGKGGMLSKLRTANRVSLLGIDMHIASGSMQSILSRIIGGEQVGTLIPAQRKKQHGLKNWMAVAAICQGKIVVSTWISDILRENKKKASILLIGVESIQGDFTEGDVIEVLDIDGKLLGKGKVLYPAVELSNAVSQFKGQSEQDRSKWPNADRIVIHCDYFVHC